MSELPIPIDPKETARFTDVKTVGELVNILQKLPQNATISLWYLWEKYSIDHVTYQDNEVFIE